MRARGKGSSPGRVEGSSRAMLASARPSCSFRARTDVHTLTHKVTKVADHPSNFGLHNSVGPICGYKPMGRHLESLRPVTLAIGAAFRPYFKSQLRHFLWICHTTALVAQQIPNKSTKRSRSNGSLRQRGNE